jgi:hypothetical protein
MQCDRCGAPARRLRARGDAVGFETLGAAGWIELQRCPGCRALWACARHEPHGARRLWTLWPHERERFEALLGAPDGEQILGEWHAAVLREDWLDLPPAERAELERWRERTGRRLNPIDQRSPARFVGRSADLGRHLEGLVAPAAAVSRDRSPVRPRSGHVRARIALSLIGLLYGACVAALAALMGGAGHGWSSGAVSSTAVAMVPVCALAWSLRDRLIGRALAALLTACMLATDAGIVLATQREGTGYLAKLWNAAPELLVAWTVLWLAWQGLTLWVLLRRATSGMHAAGTGTSPPPAPTANG